MNDIDRHLRGLVDALKAYHRQQEAALERLADIMDANASAHDALMDAIGHLAPQQPASVPSSPPDVSHAEMAAQAEWDDIRRRTPPPVPRGWN